MSLVSRVLNLGLVAIVCQLKHVKGDLGPDLRRRRVGVKGVDVEKRKHSKLISIMRQYCTTELFCQHSCQHPSLL